MGLFDKINEMKAAKSDEQPRTVYRKGGRNRWGSDANAHFNSFYDKKKRIAQHMGNSKVTSNQKGKRSLNIPRGENQDSMLEGKNENNRA